MTPTHTYPPTSTIPIGPAAAALGVSKDTLRRWYREGKFPGIRTPGGRLRFRPADIDAFLAQATP